MTLLELLEHTYLSGGFTTRSDMARVNAELVAEAALCGLLTTATPRDGFCSVWRLTAEGISTMVYETEGMLKAEAQAAYDNEPLYFPPRLSDDCGYASTTDFDAWVNAGCPA